MFQQDQTTIKNQVLTWSRDVTQEVRSRPKNIWRQALLVSAFVGGSVAAFGEVIEVDVAEWAVVSNGVTSSGWEVSRIDSYSKGEGGYTRLNTKDDYALSPAFVDIVTQVVMRVKSSAATMMRYLTITPVEPAGEAEAQAAVACEKLTDQTFAWDRAAGVRRFRLQNDGGSGNGTWAIASLAVYTDRIEPPTGLCATELYRDAFVARWEPEGRAAGYQVRYASVVRTTRHDETVAAWDFSSLTNTYGSTRTLDQLRDANPGRLDDLSGENVCMQRYEGGYLQIGMGEKLGRLVLPLLSVAAGDEEKTGVLHAWKYPANGKPTMPIYGLTGGKTNLLSTVELTNEDAEYRFSIPAGLALDGIVLSSATNGIALTDQNGRVRVKSFAVVAEYAQETVTTNDFRAVSAPKAEILLKDLGPGEWIWSVRSLDENGRESLWSPEAAVVLDEESPRYRGSGCMFFCR